LVYGCPTGFEVQHHLVGYFGRERTYALCHDTMIAGKDEALAIADLRPCCALPTSEPDSEILQLAE
jgi:hypothetical protein